MRTKCRSIATFHRPIHSHWSLPLSCKGLRLDAHRPTMLLVYIYLKEELFRGAVCAKPENIWTTLVELWILQLNLNIVCCKRFIDYHSCLQMYKFCENKRGLSKATPACRMDHKWVQFLREKAQNVGFTLALKKQDLYSKVVIILWTKGDYLLTTLHPPPPQTSKLLRAQRKHDNSEAGIWKN
jgi:hypothetical protein